VNNISTINKKGILKPSALDFFIAEGLIIFGILYFTFVVGFNISFLTLSNQSLNVSSILTPVYVINATAVFINSCVVHGGIIFNQSCKPAMVCGDKIC
jgi:hypothetical protein